MKNKKWFLKVVLAMEFAAVVVLGAEDITDKFTDPNFKTEVYKVIGKTAPAAIYDTDVDKITNFSISNKKTLSLVGIEYFIALRFLNCYDNQLTELDVSKNTKLEWLHCYYNQLTKLDVSNNTALKNLHCHTNQLTELDVSKNIALTELYCGSNQLTSLDISKNTALKYFECESNQLTSLDVSKNTELRQLYINENQLTSLDVSKNTELQFLRCSKNYFTGEDKIIGLNKALLNEFVFDPQNEGTPQVSIANKTNKTASAISFVGIKNGQINLNLKVGNYTVELYNLQGRLIEKTDITAINGVNSTGLKIDGLSRGIFVLNVKQAGVLVLKQKVRIN